MELRKTSYGYHTGWPDWGDGNMGCLWPLILLVGIPLAVYAFCYYNNHPTLWRVFCFIVAAIAWYWIYYVWGCLIDNVKDLFSSPDFEELVSNFICLIIYLVIFLIICAAFLWFLSDALNFNLGCRFGSEIYKEIYC